MQTLHLEDLTSLPLKVIYQRAMDMSIKYLNETVERVASRSLGQFVIHKTEDAIWTFEKSIEWSAPAEPKKPAEPEEVPAVTDKEMNGGESQSKEEAPPPPRPLPWVVFIPVLVMLTGTRIAYETAATILGKAAVTPATMVHFLRNKRRSLRALRIRGKRTMKTRVSNPTAFSKMMALVNPFKILSLVGFTSKKESKKDLEVSARPSPQPLPEDDGDVEENVLEKLNRLSQEPDSIENDPDFQPDSTLGSDTSTSSVGDASEDEKEASTPEDVETPRAPRTSSFIADIIQEEDENQSEGEGEVEGESTPASATPSFTLGDKAEEQPPAQVADFTPSLEKTSTPKVYPAICDTRDSAIKHISTNIFNKSLTPQSSF